MSELKGIVKAIREGNEGTYEGILFMQDKGRSLQASIKETQLVVSDPQNPNYQNVKMPENELEDFVTQYFSLLDESGERLSYPAQILQIAFFLLVLVGVVSSLYLISRSFIRQSNFLPMPLVEEVREAAEQMSLVERHSAIYATGIRDGGMVIELQRDQDYRFFDMEKVRPGRYRMVLVDDGKWWPARHAGRVALVTGERFVFYPDEKLGLVFLQRPFQRIGEDVAELPHLIFPD